MLDGTYLIEPVESEEEFKTCIKENPYLLVKASAQWCNPCKKIEGPLGELLRNNLDQNVKVMYIDIDESEDIASYLEITKIPAFFSYINGKLENSDITSNMKDIKIIIDRINSHSILG
jgi:thioredoxin 1